jgi:hypothetical protein
MGFLSAALFGGALSKSVPYFCAGMLFWSLITRMINDGAVLYVASSRYITQIKSPLTLFLLQVIWRNAILAAHNAAIYVIIAAIFVVIPGPVILLWLPGLVLGADLSVADGFGRRRRVGALSGYPADGTRHSHYSFLVYTADVFSRAHPHLRGVSQAIRHPATLTPIGGSSARRAAGDPRRFADQRAARCPLACPGAIEGQGAPTPRSGQG